MQIDWQAVSIIVSAIAVFGSSLGVFISLRKSRSEIRENDSNAANVVAQSVSALLEPLNDRIECLELENTQMKERLRKCEMQISLLEHERDRILKERSEIVIGAHRLVHQIKSISPDANPVYNPPEK